MASDMWAGSDGSSPERASPPQSIDQVDRQMIRHLLGRYTTEELARLLQEERRFSPSSSLDHPAPLSSLGPDYETLPGLESAINAHVLSDTSSTCESVTSNVSVPRPGSFRGRKRKASFSTTVISQTSTDESSWEAEEGTMATTSPKQKGLFTCSFCLEEGILKTCTRKNDLKRHMEDFHHTNAQWFCRHPGCNMVFDWQTAYKAHLKGAHSGSRLNLYDARVALCPQTVFACGFDNCQHVSEAASDAEAGLTFKEYVNHVVKHFDKGASSDQWSYSTRIRNLLRQSSVRDAFAQCGWSEAEQSRLLWDTQTSGVLRKRLETRHLGDLHFLVQYAIFLGSNSSGAIENYRHDFVTPISSECRGHGSRSPEPGLSLASYYVSPQPSSYDFHNTSPPPHQYVMMDGAKAEPFVDILSHSPLSGAEYMSHSLAYTSNPAPFGGLYAY